MGERRRGLARGRTGKIQAQLHVHALYTDKQSKHKQKRTRETPQGEAGLAQLVWMGGHHYAGRYRWGAPGGARYLPSTKRSRKKKRKRTCNVRFGWVQSHQVQTSIFALYSHQIGTCHASSCLCMYVYHSQATTRDAHADSLFFTRPAQQTDLAHQHTDDSVGTSARRGEWTGKQAPPASTAFVTSTHTCAAFACRLCR